MEQAIAAKLREKFAPEEIGKLPRVTCPDCADRRRTCSEHSKAKCDVCKAYVSTRHIHIDYVGHADVTMRLLDNDPDWDWEPLARDVDPAVLAAAVATGNPEVVQAVLKSTPPKFDLDDNGNPVGLWITLTVCGVTRKGYGSCPSGQYDAVKVLIGDALRNAAMRFGVALDLWAKGDRADPTAENATGSGGQVSRGRSRQQSAGDAWENAVPASPRSRQANGAGQSAGDAWEQAAPREPQSQPAPQAAADDPLLGEWAAKIDEISSAEDGAAALAELDRARSIMASNKYAGIKGAIQARVRAVTAQRRPSRPAGPSAEERGAQPVPTGKGDDGEWVQGWLQRLAEATEDGLGALQSQIGAAVKSKKISPAKSADLAKALRERRNELQPVSA